VSGGSSPSFAWGAKNISSDNTKTNDTKTCPYFVQYLKQGDRDGKKGINEIKKMQTFLNEQLGIKLPISGTFGLQTKKAVEQYQVKYADKVLAPWNFSKPTGRWYQSTRNLANSHVGCNEGEIILDNGKKVNN
jgi:hypothetical protein